MQQTHCMRWYCPAKTHRSEVFASQEELIEHMKAKHPGKFDEAQLPFLVENSRRPLKRIFDACPLVAGRLRRRRKAGKTISRITQLAVPRSLSLPPPEDLHNTDDASTMSNANSRGEEKVAVSRATMKSERHLMPPAIFSHEDDNPSDTARRADDAIPDIKEQKRMDITQSWQIIRMGKLKTRTADQLITEAEQRRETRS